MRVGFLLTYAAFAYGCVVIGLAVGRFRDLRPRWSGPGLLAISAIGALALPAIEFPAETLNGFQGLDLLSLVASIGLAAVTVTAVPLRRMAAACLVGILGGNLLIQHFTTRGSTDRYGLFVAAVAAGGAALWAAAGVRGAPEGRR